MRRLDDCHLAHHQRVHARALVTPRRQERGILPQGPGGTCIDGVGWSRRPMSCRVSNTNAGLPRSPLLACRMYAFTLPLVEFLFPFSTSICLNIAPLAYCAAPIAHPSPTTIPPPSLTSNSPFSLPHSSQKIFGLLLAESCVLALPLDVANNSINIGCAQGWVESCGGLNMGLFWKIMYVLVTLLCVVVLPFAIFYYEVRVF